MKFVLQHTHKYHTQGGVAIGENGGRVGSQEMLVRAVVEEKADEVLVITVYITSKIGKYKYRKGTTP